MTDTSRPSRATGTAPREQVAERTNARLNSLLRPARIAGAIKSCQYIAGTPSHDDACKCGAAVVPGTAWCRPHYDLVFGIEQQNKLREAQVADGWTFPGLGYAHADRVLAGE